MELIIRMDMANAAFNAEEDQHSYEAARLLRKLARDIQGHRYFEPGFFYSIRANGNEVGFAQVK